MTPIDPLPDSPAAPASASAPDHAWHSPAPSLSSRRLKLRSRGASRVQIVGGAVPTMIVCESDLERKAVYVLLADPDVVELREQPPAIEYIDRQGVKRTHTFDMVVTRRDGSRIAVAVKPSHRAERSGLRATLALIAAQMPRHFADGVQLLTEQQLHRDAVHDALLIHTMRRRPNPAHDEQLRALVAQLAGQATVRSLVAASGLGSHGFGSVVRLIAEGTLAIIGRRRIGYDTVVRPVSLGEGRP